MTRLEFPRGLEGTERLPKTKKTLQNVFHNGRWPISRPGIEEIVNTGGVARGSFVWNDSLYDVVSDTLRKITDKTTGAFTEIGTIDGNVPIKFAIGFNDAVIVVPNGSIFALSNSTTQIAITGVTSSGGVASFTHAGTTPAIGNTVTISGFTTNTAYNVTGVVTASSATTFEISSIAFGSDETGQFTLVLSVISGNANFAPCAAVTHINGRFVYIPFSGDPAFFSDVGAAGTVQVLSFFDAEELPDKNNEVFNLNNTLYITGTDSIQPFSDTGASPVPFVPIQRSRISAGYIGGLLEYENSFAFIGRIKDQAPGIFILDQGVAKRLSNEPIQFILSTYTVEELADVNAVRFEWRGYDIAAFKLARDSFGFFFGNWFLLDTVFDGDSSPWGADFISQFEGEYFVSFNDRFGKLARISTDYGERITRIIEMSLTQESGDWFSIQSIELTISQGFNTADGSVALFLSRDNVLYGPPLYRNLGDLGEYAKELKWNYPGGLGAYDGFMGIRLYTTEDIDFSSEFLIYKPRK